MQNGFAGIGNWMADEILWHARIDPRVLCGQLTVTRARRLWREARKVCRVAMATYLGEQIARRMAGEPIEHPLFDDRFRALPMYRGILWLLPLAGAYYRVKDWLQ